MSPVLSSRVEAISLPLEQPGRAGCQPHHVFAGSTADLDELRCHVSVLRPGQEPRPLQRHEQEEVLVVLGGEPTLVVERGTRAMRRGSFAFNPAGFAHAMRNESDAPATYVVFRWTATRPSRRAGIEHRVVDALAKRPGAAGDGKSAVSLLDGPTRHLRHLNAHLTVLERGVAYEPHVDPYDIGIVVLEGAIETLGATAEPNAVVFYASGEPHGMRNVGDVPAVYLVFELRGHRWAIAEKRENALLKRLANAARHPRAAAAVLRRRFVGRRRGRG